MIWSLTFFYTWLNQNILAVISLVLTLYLLYYYLVEKNNVSKISRKYREALFESQSKLFLSALKHVIAGNKDLAIKELEKAQDINHDNLETSFTLGNLFRTNGDIDKAIATHHAIIAQNKIDEDSRLRAIIELGIDYDRAGFIDEAIKSFKDALSMNRDLPEVVESLCRLFEMTGEWDEALKHRLMLSKLTRKDQSETLSHILVKKGEQSFLKGDIESSVEHIEDAYRFSPSVSVKLLELKLALLKEDSVKIKKIFDEIFNQHPNYLHFVFASLDEAQTKLKTVSSYSKNLLDLKKYFLEKKWDETKPLPSIILSKIIITKQMNDEKSFNQLRAFLEKKNNWEQSIHVELLKIFLAKDLKEDVYREANSLLTQIQSSTGKYHCGECGYSSDLVFWRCPQCHQWETIQIKWTI